VSQCDRQGQASAARSLRDWRHPTVVVLDPARDVVVDPA
jgi:hypothetical protein